MKTRITLCFCLPNQFFISMIKVVIILQLRFILLSILNIKGRNHVIQEQSEFFFFIQKEHKNKRRCVKQLGWKQLNKYNKTDWYDLISIAFYCQRHRDVPLLETATFKFLLVNLFSILIERQLLIRKHVTNKINLQAPA